MLILNGIVSVDIQKGDTTDSFIKISDGSVLKNYEERKSTVFKSKEYMDSLKFLFEKSSV